MIEQLWNQLSRSKLQEIDGGCGAGIGRWSDGDVKSIAGMEHCFRADLSGCKDYHKRHKVCEMHSKAPKAIAGRIEQRFCQQCSRFHVLSEFDEGKRSCRRRLASHNEWRRKPHPETHSLFGQRNANALYGDTSRLGLGSPPFYFPEFL